jgi:TolB-like protein
MSFFQELRRRNVFKVATVYIVTSWLVIQVGSIVMPAFDAPDWVMKTLIVLLLFGFLIAVILAWAFEVTHDGVKRDFNIPFKESDIGNSGRKLNFIIIGLLIADLGYFIYQSRFDTQSTETQVTETRLTDDAKNKSELLSDVVAYEQTSIAVLPFVNMSSDPEQEYFSDGISEEILNVLAKIPNLHVTSRSSAFAFKGGKINITEVAAKLGVKHVLEGSVRKSGTTVRITAQLISANTDKHLWSDTYDRELDDIFKVQDEISAAIVDSLAETLGIDLVKTASTAQAINPEAYDYYLQGLRGLRIQTFDSLRNAVIAFESAIKIAPDYLPARIKLAEVFISQINTGSRSD